MAEAVASAARAIVENALVWDNHACMPLRPGDASFLTELDAVRAAGVDMISLNIGCGTMEAEAHLAMMAAFTAWIEARSDRFRLVRSLADIEGAQAAGQLGIQFDVEGMAPLDGGRIDLVEQLRLGGVGWMLVAYNRNNDAGGGCADEDRGLTGYGRAILAEMKRVGMIVCCSHTGHRTARNVFEAADNPVIFSHSNALAVADHYRNIPDELIRACAATGGVIGINGLGTFLGENDASAARVARHIDHVVQLVGPAHAGLGLDYVFDRQELADFLRTMRQTYPDDESYRQPITMLPPTRIVEIVQALLDWGYPRDAITAILGENWRRVAAKVWKN